MLLVANVANTKWCKKPVKLLKSCHMGTPLRVLGESYPMSTNMTGFRWFLKIFASLCFGQNSLSIGRVNGWFWGNGICVTPSDCTSCVSQWVASSCRPYPLLMNIILANTSHACSSQYCLTFFAISLWQKRYSEKSWRRIVHPNYIYDYSSNILRMYA